MYHNGINVPLFALRTATSGGIGEFPDLIPLINWAVSQGLDTLQILPINDSGLDSSPYNIQSAFALNPLYIKWPGLICDSRLPYVQYEAVREQKDRAAKKALWPTKAIQQFASQYPWVEAYAKNNKGDQSIFEQYVAHQQMHAVKLHAEERRLQLLGDLPILISKDSTDVKTHPELFDTNLSAGAPPDLYAKEGQNWGFPLYNWDAMAQSDFRWWRERLAYASQFYHLYRLDHVVGFFRIWACEPGQKATEGHFIPREKSAWLPQGEKILKVLLQSSSMQPIGEDLGTVPEEVRTTLAALGIPGTKVIRWERKWHEPTHPFIPLDSYPFLSLTTVSTHDSSLLKAWWRLHPDEARAWAAFAGWEWEAELPLFRLREILRQSHHTTSQYHINLLPEYLSALLDSNLAGSNDEVRLNRPGVISPLNWSWRMPFFIEDLPKIKALSALLRYCLN